ADDMVGPNSDNALYGNRYSSILDVYLMKHQTSDCATRFAPKAGVGIVHAWYPTNKSQFNSLQKLNIAFPQSIGLAASFDKNLAYAAGRAIGAEARSIGIRACLSPVLDLGKEPRWGRVQEARGEDFVLTSHMGVAYASGLSKNGSRRCACCEGEYAVIMTLSFVDSLPAFAAHGSPRGGLNAAPFIGRGSRQV
ncbi:glycoside hydrolase superfamily, partial [Mycena olivaceomarginata]